MSLIASPVPCRHAAGRPGAAGGRPRRRPVAAAAGRPRLQRCASRQAREQQPDEDSDDYEDLDLFLERLHPELVRGGDGGEAPAQPEAQQAARLRRQYARGHCYGCGVQLQTDDPQVGGGCWGGCWLGVSGPPVGDTGRPHVQGTEGAGPQSDAQYKERRAVNLAPPPPPSHRWRALWTQSGTR